MADRYKQAELGEAMQTGRASGARSIWRGRASATAARIASGSAARPIDGKVKTAPSLLLRSAFADAVCLRDPANNLKLAKARSTGRIDAAAATVLAVAEGARMAARPRSRDRIAWG